MRGSIKILKILYLRREEFVPRISLLPEHICLDCKGEYTEIIKTIKNY